MGKKEKKVEKAPPSDVFDPLNVDAHQAATCVLMLDSPEEDVLAKACEALYKFVEKGDENKKTLLDLNAVDHLLQLIKHEDRIVRRNSCMVFGLMTANADVRKMLRKREETISSVVGLLAPEEDTLCHEFAALALSSMAADYSSKVTICENEGLESLIRCLSENDPDVQKNSVEAISLLVLDYQARAAIRELGGIPPILELIKSEYPVIQHQALLALERITLDTENRAALREVDGLTQLVAFIGNSEYSDLHVFAVMVLSNCLEDLESIEMIKESGGLMKLVSYITDVPPADDDGDKKKPAAKEKGKGKSGKEDKGKPKSDKKAKADEGEIIPTLPDVKQHAAKAIGRAAKSANNKKVLHEAEVEKMFIHLFSHDDVKVQAAAIEALGIMAEFGLSRDSIIGWEGLEPLVKMLKRDDQPELLEAVTLALANLTNGNVNNVKEVLNMGGVDSLITLLSHNKETVISNTCVILSNMSTDEEVRADILKHGVIAALITPLQSKCDDVQAKSAMAVAAFVFDADGRNELRSLGGVEPLVTMLHSADSACRRNASWAISVCAVDDQTAMLIASLGGLETLQSIQLSTTRRNAFTEAALERLLNHNLSAKYALTGFLGSHNLIQDGFFDAGRQNPDQSLQSLDGHLEDDIKLFEYVDTDRALRSLNNVTTDGFHDQGAVRKGSKLQPLEALCKMELDQKRPVILINPAPDPAYLAFLAKVEMRRLAHAPHSLPIVRRSSSPKPAPESVKDEGKPEKGKSRSGRDSKSPDPKKAGSKSKGKKEKDEEKEREEEEQKQREAEEAASKDQEREPFVPPPDPYLLKYIEEVNERIMPLPTSKEQVIALAQYVASKMGGPIARGQVGLFSWELAISQLKYERRSNVIPIGYIKSGIHVHRALLFKALADRIGVGCTLERGDYNRAWNTVMLFDEDGNGALKYPPKAYVVDLIHSPGCLLLADSPESEPYKKI